MGTTSESAAEAWDQLWAGLTAAGYELPHPHPDVARLAEALGVGR